MSHKVLYRKGLITLSEFRELNLLKARAKNKHFVQSARKEANREYREKERYYKARAKQKRKAYKDLRF